MNETTKLTRWLTGWEERHGGEKETGTEGRNEIRKENRKHNQQRTEWHPDEEGQAQEGVKMWEKTRKLFYKLKPKEPRL